MFEHVQAYVSDYFVRKEEICIVLNQNRVCNNMFNKNTFYAVILEMECTVDVQAPFQFSTTDLQVLHFIRSIQFGYSLLFKHNFIDLILCINLVEKKIFQ